MPSTSIVGWEDRTLEDLATIKKGSIATTTNGGAGVPYLGADSLAGAPPRLFTQSTTALLVDPSDVVMLWDGERSGLCGIGLRGAAGSTLARLRPRSAVDPKFLYWALTGQYEHIQSHRTGTGIPHVPKDLGTFLRLPVPTSAREQRRIAAMLDAVDEAIRSTERLISKLDSMRQGLLRDLLAYGVDARGELRSPGKKSGAFHATSIGLLPTTWQAMSMHAVTERIVDGVHKTPDYRTSGRPFLTVENLTRSHGISVKPCRYISASDHRIFIRHVDPRPGDVLVSKDGTLGVARIVPEWLSDFSIFVSIAMLRPRPDVVLPDLVSAFFSSDYYRRQLGTQSGGTGLKHIVLSQFRGFVLPVPPLDEQERIFAALQSHDNHADILRSELSKLGLLRLGLTDDLLTGRVRVSLGEDAA